MAAGLRKNFKEEKKKRDEGCLCVCGRGENAINKKKANYKKKKRGAEKENTKEKKNPFNSGDH